MHLKTIVLKQFKTYRDFKLENLDEGRNVLVGFNGAGKSNIIDAILFCLTDQIQINKKLIHENGLGSLSTGYVEVHLGNSDGTFMFPPAWKKRGSATGAKNNVINIASEAAGVEGDADGSAIKNVTNGNHMNAMNGMNGNNMSGHVPTVTGNGDVLGHDRVENGNELVNVADVENGHNVADVNGGLGRANNNCLSMDTSVVKIRRWLVSSRGYQLNGKNISKQDLQGLLEAAGINAINPHFCIKQGRIAEWARMSDRKRLETVKEMLLGSEVMLDKRQQMLEAEILHISDQLAHAYEMLVDFDSKIEALEKDVRENELFCELDLRRCRLEYILGDTELKITTETMGKADSAKRVAEDLMRQKSAEELEKRELLKFEQFENARTLDLKLTDALEKKSFLADEKEGELVKLEAKKRIFIEGCKGTLQELDTMINGEKANGSQIQSQGANGSQTKLGTQALSQGLNDSQMMSQNESGDALDTIRELENIGDQSFIVEVEKGKKFKTPEELATALANMSSRKEKAQAELTKLRDQRTYILWYLKNLNLDKGNLNQQGGKGNDMFGKRKGDQFGKGFGKGQSNAFSPSLLSPEQVTSQLKDFMRQKDNAETGIRNSEAKLDLLKGSLRQADAIYMGVKQEAEKVDFQIEQLGEKRRKLMKEKAIFQERRDYLQREMDTKNKGLLNTVSPGIKNVVMIFQTLRRNSIKYRENPEWKPKNDQDRKGTKGDEKGKGEGFDGNGKNGKGFDGKGSKSVWNNYYDMCLEDVGVALEDFYGTLLENIHCDPVYNIAVESVGSVALFHFLVASDSVASKIVSLVRKERLGCVECVPVGQMQWHGNAISNRMKNNVMRMGNGKGKGKNGSDYMHNSMPMMEAIQIYNGDRNPHAAKLRVVIEQVFGSHMICEDLEGCEKICRQTGRNCITLSGDRVYGNGIMSGGHIDPNNFKRMRIMREFRELEKELDRHIEYGKSIMLVAGNNSMTDQRNMNGKLMSGKNINSMNPDSMSDGGMNPKNASTETDAFSAIESEQKQLYATRDEIKARQDSARKAWYALDADINLNYRKLRDEKCRLEMCTKDIAQKTLELECFSTSNFETPSKNAPEEIQAAEERAAFEKQVASCTIDANRQRLKTLYDGEVACQKRLHNLDEGLQMLQKRLGDGETQANALGDLEARERAEERAKLKESIQTSTKKLASLEAEISINTDKLRDYQQQKIDHLELVKRLETEKAAFDEDLAVLRENLDKLTHDAITHFNNIEEARLRMRINKKRIEELMELRKTDKNRKAACPVGGKSFLKNGEEVSVSCNHDVDQDPLKDPLNPELETAIIIRDQSFIGIDGEHIVIRDQSLFEINDERTKELAKLGIPEELKNLGLEAMLYSKPADTIPTLRNRIHEIGMELEKMDVNRHALDELPECRKIRDEMEAELAEVSILESELKKDLATIRQKRRLPMPDTMKTDLKLAFADVFKQITGFGTGDLVFHKKTVEVPDEAEEEDDGNEEQDAGPNELDVVKVNPSASRYSIEKSVAPMKRQRRRRLSVLSAKCADENAKVTSIEVDDSIQMLISFNSLKRTPDDVKTLSGGQKTVCAVCLLLALLRLRPAPFYLLDEVDAALDTDYRMNLAHYIKNEVDKHNHPISVSRKSDRENLGDNENANGCDNQMVDDLGDVEMDDVDAIAGKAKNVAGKVKKTQMILTSFREELVGIGDRLFIVQNQDRCSTVQEATEKEALAVVRTANNFK